MAVVIEDVIGDFETIERDQGLHPVTPVSRGVLVYVDPAGYRWFRLARRQPLRRLETVAVSAVIDRHKVESNGVLGVDV